MAAIILPHKWRTKPHGPVAINRASSIGKDISFCYLAGAPYSGVDLVSGSMVAAAAGSDNSIKSTVYGLGVQFENAGRFEFTSPKPIPANSTRYTLALLSSPLNNTGRGDSLSVHGAGSQATLSINAAQDGSGNVGGFGFFEYDGSFNAQAQSANTVIGSTANRPRLFVAVRDGASAKVYADGIDVTSSSGGDGGTSTVQTTVYVGSVPSSGGHIWPMLYAAVIPRAAAAAEIKAWADEPFSIFAPLRRRLYFFAPAGAGQTIAVGQVTETDLAQAIAHLKSKALGQVTETDLAQALTAAKRLAIGQVTESSTAQPLTAAKRATVNQTTETDTAQSIARAKAKELGQTTETDLAQAITASGNKIIAVGQITETDTAQAIARAKAKQLGQTTETDTAQAIARAKAKLLGQTIETDLAQAITPSIPNQVGQATESDTAQSLTARKTKVLGQVAEADVAQAVTHAKTKGLGLALEIDLGQPITWAPKRRIVGQALETDLAQAITASLSSTQLPLGKRYTVGPRAGFVVGARNSFRVDQ